MVSRAQMVRLLRGGSRPPTPAPDIIAPVLSNPVDMATGSATAAIFVDTDEANGSLYWFISTSATPPSASALKAGTGAIQANARGVTQTGTQEITIAGLTSSTSYYAHFLHQDAAGNDSAIVSGNGFTTSAETPGFTPDYTVNTWSQLNALLTGGTDLSNKKVLVANDCSGAAITLVSKTWPGLVVRGADASTRPNMPRLIFNGCHGASGNPIQFRYLDFYNVRTASATSEGQITVLTNTSSHFEFDRCKLHDDPFPTKTFRKSGYAAGTLFMYWGFGRNGGGKWDNLVVHDCEIFNVTRSIFAGSNITTYRNQWHDHYIHAFTLIGNNQSHTQSDCWNLWANPTDTSDPHAGIAISPACETGVDTADILVEGIRAVAGTARREWAIANGVVQTGWDPGASGIKFNDALNHAANYVRCTVRNCLLVGSDSIMLEFDGGIDCVGEFNTLVHDRTLSNGEPSVFTTLADNTIIRHNHCYSAAIGTEDGAARGTPVYYGNMPASNGASGSSSLTRYESIFVGPTFSGFATIAEAVAAFAPNPTHPSSSWGIKPGAMNYYDWDAGVGDWPDSDPAASNNSTSNTPSLVTKAATAWNRTATGPAGTGAWIPSNLRRGTIVHRFSTDTDSGTKSLFTCGSSMGYVMKLPGSSDGAIRIALRNASVADILLLTTEAGVTVADGICHYVMTWDLDQARALFAMAAGGEVRTDIPTISAMLAGQDWGLNTKARNLTFGAGAITTPTDGFSGQQDIFLMEDQFLDIETDAGFSKVFNTSGGLPDLGASGQNVFGSTPGIFLKGNAAAWNGSNFNLGDGMGGTGAATATKFAKGGAGVYA